jgi:hypothetical protein
MNSFVKKYIDAQADINKAEGQLRKMGWSSRGVCDMKVNPKHFNYFFFEVTIKNVTSTLTIKDAKSLAIYLLKNTENVPDDSLRDIVEEIIKAEGE